MNDLTKEEILFNYQQLQQEFESLKSIHDESLMRQNEIENKFQVRLRTMQCHNQISELQYASDLANDEFFEKIVQILPSFWQYPEFAEASVQIGDKVYSTNNFTEVEHSQKQPIRIKNRPVGKIEIGYRAGHSLPEDELFLKEEEKLLFAVAERIGDFIEKNKAREQAQKLERKLNKQEALNQTILAASPDAIAVVNLEGKVLYASAKAFDLFRANDETDILNHSIFEFIHPDDRGAAQERVKNMVNRDLREPMEHRAIGVDGSVFFIEANGDILYDKDRNPNGIVLVVRNITERKLTEQNLRQSEQTYRNLVESISEVVFEIGIDGIVTYISPAIKRYTNRTSEEFIGQNFFNLVYPDDLPYLIDIFKNNRFSEFEYIEYRILIPETGIRWVQVSAQTKLDSENKPIKRVGIIRDITDLKIAEEKLRNSEEKYRRLVESINDVIYEVTFDGIIHYISPAVEKLIGYSAEELTGKNFLPLVHPDDLSYMTRRMGDRAALKIDPVDFRFIAKDGNLVWVRSLPSPLLEKGKIVGRSGILSDVTARKKAEAELQKNSEKFRSLVETISDVIYEVDLTGKLLYCSPSVEGVLGYTEVDVLGKNIFEFIYPEDLDFVQKSLASIENRKDKYIEYRYVAKDGSVRWVRSATSPKYEDGILIGGTGSLTDITDKKLAEIELRKLSEAVKQSPVSIVLTNLDGNIEYANPKACETTGYSFEELYNQNPRVLKSGETPISEYEYMWDSISHGNVWRGIFHNKRKNGELYWESSQITPVLDKEGKIINYLAIKEDITERKKTQEDLMRSEGRFSEITEQSQNVIWETNSEAVYTFVSPAAKTAWGLNPEDLVGKKRFFDIHPEEGRKEFIELCFQQIQAGRQFIGMESRVKGNDGKINWALTNGMPIFDSGGNVMGYRGSSININEQKRAFQELRESEERYKSIFRDSKSVMLIVDPENGFIVDANEKAASFYGWSLDELRQKRLADIDTITDSEARAKMKETLSGNQKEFILKHRLANGSTRDVEVFAGPISIGEKKLLFGIIHDVTERRLAEEALIQRERDLNFSQEIAGMGSWQLNLATNTSKWSDNMYRILGLDPEKDKASQDLFFKLIHPDDRHLIDDYIEKILSDRKQVTFEMRMNLISGKTIWIQNSMIPGFEGDQLVTLNGTNVDITEKKESENELREREEELNRAQGMAGLGSWSLDLLTAEMKWSENYYHMMGIPLGTEVTAATFEERVHPEDLHLVEEYHEEMRRTKKAVSYDIRLLFENNQYRWIQNNIFPFFENGEIVLLKGVFIDITDKKLTEDQIKSQNRTLNAIITAIPDLIFVIDKDGQYLEVFVNEDEKLLVSPEKIVGSNINEAFSKEMADMFLEKIRESINKKIVVTIDYVISLANSPSTDFEARIVPIDQEKVLILSRDVTEKAIREKELKRLSTAVQQSPVITVVTDLNANIEYANPAFEQITGYKLEEVIGKNPRILKSGLTERKVYEELWTTILSGKTWHGEWMNRKKSGERYWEDVTISPITDESGKIINYLAVKQDISERKRAEQEILELNTNLEQKIQERTKELAAANFNLLNEIEVRKLAEKALTDSEEKYRSVVENVKEVIFITDADGNWVFLNHAWEEITGFSVEESVGKLFVDYVHPDDRTRNWELFEPLIKREKEYCRHEIRYLTKDGGFRWIEVYARLSLDEANQIIGTLGTLMDVTDRKRAEEMVLLQKSRLESIIEGSSIGTWEWNIQTGETIFNDKWAEIIGYTLEELAPVSIDTWAKYSHPDDLQLSRELLEKHFKGESDIYVFETRMKHKDGSWVWVLDSGKVISWSESGTPLWMYGSHLDITERKRTEMFENELLQLSPKLTGISLPEIDPAVNLALSRIGTFLNADRSYIFEFDSDLKYMNNTYEWCQDEIEPQIEYLQHIPTDIFPHWLNMLQQNENIIIPSVKDLPDSWQAEREILEPQGIQSLVAIPLYIEQKLIGFVGLDLVKTNKVYNKLELNTLTIWSSMLSSLINTKRTETLIEQTRQNFQTFFNTIDDFLIILDHNGKIIHANDAFHRRLGYTNEEMLSKTVFDVRALDRRDETIMTLGRIMRGETDFCSIPFVTKSGEQIPVETRIKLGLWNGESRFFAVSKDISQIKLSEEKFSAAFQSNSAMMAISDFYNGELLDVNQAFINVVGYTKEEIIGRTIFGLGVISKTERQNITAHIELESAVFESEIVFMTKNKEQRTGLYSARSIFIGDKRSLLSIIIDITERKRNEENLKLARLEAEKANKAKSEFLSRMSHELRTPMNSILGFAQLLEMGELNVGQKKGVTHILKSGRHLLDLINEVLDISRIEAGRISLSIEPIKLSIIIPEMLSILEPLAVKNQVTINFVGGLDDNIYVKADRQRLKQVLLNLINNAVKYNKKNGFVSVSVEHTDLSMVESSVRILIRDTGIGIKSEDISRLFNPFERIGADKTETEGTGLGLAVAKKLVEAMGGTLGVESEPGLGSLFWIELPQSDGQLEHSKNLGQLIANGQNVETVGEILYVEDNPSNVELVEQILFSQRPGIQMVTTINGMDAVKLAVEHAPDLILLDLNLPDIHGSKVLEQLLQNEQTKTIPVVIVSADAMPHQLKRLIADGAKEYITKPLDVGDLLRVVDIYVKRVQE